MLVRYIILCLQGTVSFTFIVLAFQVSFEEEGIMSECRKRADADAADAGPFFSHTCAYNTRWGNRINYCKVEDPILEKMNFESETCTFNRQ